MSLKTLLLSLFFPKTCHFCHLPGTNLCEQCKEKHFIPFVKTHCHVCNGLLRSPHIFVHGLCQQRTCLDGVFASFVFNPKLKEYISSIKYSFYTDLLSELSQNIKYTLANRCFVIDLVSWVPLHPARQHWRGFNQAELIAKTISFNALPTLKKTHTTLQQVHLPKIARKKNLANVFTPISPFVKNKNILLCDDVYTTGSTLESCAAALKRYGATRVYAYVLAQDLLPADAAIIEALGKR